MRERRSGRRRGYDYSRAGTYFVTVCTRERVPLFGTVRDGEMCANDLGNIVRRCWGGVPDHHCGVVLDEFVLMPDHVHGILRIDIERSGLGTATIRASPNLGQIVGSFKSAVTRLINLQRAMPLATVWQRGYYEHLVRDEDDLRRIRDYIIGNPRMSHP